MRKLKMVVAAILLVVILVGVEIYIIRGASKYEPEVEIVFASVKINEKTVITSDMLEIKKVGLGSAHKLSTKKPEEVIGKKAIMDIESGEMMLSSKVGLDEMKEIKVKDKNNRLFSVEFKGDQANGWWVLTGQNVDIIFVPNENYKNGKQTLKKIRVAALIDEKGKLLENSDRATLPRYISFEVTDEQADFLAAAKGGGRLELSVIPEE